MTSTVKVSNLSTRATRRDIQDFFSFSGEIVHIELQSEGDWSQAAYVTFKEPQALDTALLLSGATIVDQSVSITPVEDYQPSSAAQELMSRRASEDTIGGGNAATRAQDVITSMLAKGFILSKDAMSKARSFDEKHQLTANATATVSSFDKKVGISQKLSAGTAAVNERMKAVDQKFQVSEKTKSVFAVAEQKVNSAGSAILRNKYLFTSAAWVTGAFNKVAKAAGEVGQKTMEKVQLSETQKPSSSYGGEYHSDDEMANNFARVSVSKPSEPAAVSIRSPANSAVYSTPPAYDSSFRGYSSTTQASSENSKSVSGQEPTL